MRKKTKKEKYRKAKLSRLLKRVKFSNFHQKPLQILGLRIFRIFIENRIKETKNVNLAKSRF